MPRFIVLSNTPKYKNKKYEHSNNTLINSLGNVSRIAYISSETDCNRKYFMKTKMFYDRVGDFEIDYFDYDEEYSERQTSEISSYDAVHFSTGNTYTFLKNIVSKGELGKLKEAILKVNLVVGTSAGAHILCNNIEYASFGDENTINLNIKQGLGVLDFYIVPHYERKSDHSDEIERFREDRNDEVYYLNDGEGIFYNDDDGYIKILKSK